MIKHILYPWAYEIYTTIKTRSEFVQGKELPSIFDDDIIESGVQRGLYYIAQTIIDEYRKLTYSTN